MRIVFFTICFFIWSTTFVNAQCYNRYTTSIFQHTTASLDWNYGQSVTTSGDTLSLYLDVYEPANDVLTVRPLIVLLHGDNLVDGGKAAANTVDLAEQLALRGFVVAAIDYRQPTSLMQLLDSTALFEHSLRAAQDAKAAVRFFRKNAAFNNNFQIDTNAIFMAGVGAGAMVAHMVVYLDSLDTLSTDFQQVVNDLGGLEGNSGNAGFSSEVHALISLDGATINPDWMLNQEMPLVQVHGLSNNYFPYEEGLLFRYTLDEVCNGHHELCYRRFNEVATVMTHNGHAHLGDFSVLAANQNDDIAAQLDFGLRGIGMKLYYTNSFFCGGSDGLYAYHGDPFLGCESFSTIGGQIRSFMDTHPNEVVAITIEGGANIQRIADGFDAANLTPYLYQHTFGEPWPTLGELVASGKRLIVFTSTSTNGTQGFHDMWSFMWDTNYNHQNPSTFDCAKDRGNHNADLFLLNHFITVATPQILWAQTINEWDYLLDRARGCWDANGQMPNFLFLDFYEEGDVLRALDSLNGIGQDFPLVYGSFVVDSIAGSNGLASDLLPMNGGYTSFLETSEKRDSALHFVGAFLIEQFPCVLNCVEPSDSISGNIFSEQTVQEMYNVDAHTGSSYHWLVEGGNIIDTLGNVVTVEWTDLGAGQLQMIETTSFGCVLDTLSLQVTIDAFSGIQTWNAHPQMVVAPNPFSNYIQVTLPQIENGPICIQLYDLMGRKIESGSSTGRSFSLDWPLLESGVYILEVKGQQDYKMLIIRK